VGTRLLVDVGKREAVTDTGHQKRTE
jgi:hypothetical protein